MQQSLCTGVPKYLYAHLCTRLPNTCPLVMHEYEELCAQTCTNLSILHHCLCTSMHTRAHACTSAHKCVHVCRNVNKCETWVHKCAQVCRRVHMCEQMCTSVHKCAYVSRPDFMLSLFSSYIILLTFSASPWSISPLRSRNQRVLR